MRKHDMSTDRATREDVDIFLLLASLLFMCLRYIEANHKSNATTSPQHLPRWYSTAVWAHSQVNHANLTKDSDHDRIH